MLTIQATAEMESLFGGIDQPAKIRGASGEVLGIFEPQTEMARRYAEARNYFSQEELDRIDRSDEPTYTTAQVLAHLNSPQDSKPTQTTP